MTTNLRRLCPEQVDFGAAVGPETFACVFSVGVLAASGGARVKMTEERLRRWFGQAAQDFSRRRRCHGRVFFGSHRMKKVCGGRANREMAVRMS